MATAFHGLEKRLRRLSNIILQKVETDDTDQKDAVLKFYYSLDDVQKIAFARRWRNYQLKRFREKALEHPFETEEYNVKPGALTARLFSYIHNEFNFNSPRPIARCARICHLVFAPLYTEKLEVNDPSSEGRPFEMPYGLFPREDDSFKILRPTTARVLNFLWKKSRQDPAQDDVPLSRRTFRGGKDKIFEYVRELFDFTEPYITTKRSVIAYKKKFLDETALPDALAMTKALDDSIRAAGPSNRLTNTVEFFASGPPNVTHFRWTRHARPYQTITLTHEIGASSIVDQPSEPFKPTALDAFPEDIFDDVFGRYVQGANWLIVPVEAFFNVSLGAPKNPRKQAGTGGFLRYFKILDGTAPTLAQALAKLSGIEDPANLTALGENPSEWDRPNSDERIAAIFDLIKTDDAKSSALDHFMIAATESFLRGCFGQDETGRQYGKDAHGQRSEYAGIKCMDGRAYVFSNLRNSGSAGDSQAGGSENQSANDIFTRSVVIDCGMNRFQRGRLIQNMAEFATERSMALLWIARFRLLHSALNAIEARLNLAVSNYHNNREQLSDKETISLWDVEDEEIVPFDYWDALHRDLVAEKAPIDPTRPGAAKERKLIVALEFLSSCLTILNDVVEGGIVDRASATLGAVDILDGKLDSIREEAIVGHQSLRDFLHRRFIPAARVIGRTGERYHRLRDRIAEIADLTNASLSATEWHEHQKQARRQTILLSVAEFFGEAALCYYTAHVIVGSEVMSTVAPHIFPISISTRYFSFSLLGGLAHWPEHYTYFVALAATLSLWLASAYHMIKLKYEERGENLWATVLAFLNRE